jgi:hypothetical protein
MLMPLYFRKILFLADTPALAARLGAEDGRAANDRRHADCPW